MPGPRPRLLLHYSQWPTADRTLWERAFGGDDPFDDAAAARLATSSRQQYLTGWRRFLGFLALEEAAALEIAPADRLTIERVRAFVAHLAETNIPRSVAIQVDALYKAARLMMPDIDWTWLKAVKRKLHAAAPARGPTGPVITSVQLLHLGQELMDEIAPEQSAPLRLAEAIAYRDGLMIALLAFVPLRRKNLAAIDIGRQLVQEGNGWFVTVPCNEAKTNAPIEFAMPEILVPYLEVYLTIVRPRILQNAICKALWVSAKGGALSYSAFWGVIHRHTTNRLGIHFAPHDVRDAAATTWAIARPEQIGVARDLLGHADLRTTTRHYNRARGIEASRAYADAIASLCGGKTRVANS
jgi:integrase